MLESLSARRPTAPPARIRTESLGGGSALAHAGGEVTGRLIPIALDRRHARAFFELRVDNGTSATIAAFAYPLGERSGLIDWHAGLVPPYSAIAIRLDLPYDRTRPRGAVAELFSRDASITLEAPAPRIASCGATRRAALATACAILAAGVAGLAAARPAIVALAAPERVTMGRPFALAYATTESADVRFAVRTPDGIVVRRGSLEPGTGTFSLDLPLTPRGLAYDVELDASGALGADRRIVRAWASVPPPAGDRRRARIDAFALASDTVRGGDPVVVSYRTTARSGVVALLDQYGTERAIALLSHRGRSVLIAPPVDRDEDFRVVLTAGTARSADMAAAALHVLAGPAVAPGAPPGAATPRRTSRRYRFAGIVRGPIALDAARVASGQSFVIHVLKAEPRLRIALDDDDGTELSAVRPRRGVRRIVMHAPPMPATYTLVASYSLGAGQDSIVVPLRVGAAPGT